MQTIKIINLTKRYNYLTILNDITYDLKLGQTYILLGANGSGKSTFIKALLGLIKFQGQINQIKDKKISYIPETINFPDYISIYDFLENIGRIKQINNLKDQIYKNLHEWNLYESKDKLIHCLSKGMKQKILIINALLGDYDIYIFDEPLNGLDVKNQQLFLEKLSYLKANNKTIIISTHYVGFYNDFSDIILEIKTGQLYEKII